MPLKRIFEVERRYPDHLKQIPDGFEKTYEMIGGKDLYYSVDPQIRIRKFPMVYPKVDLDQRIVVKEPMLGETTEYEAKTGDFEIVKRVLDHLSNPVISITGSRTTYKRDSLLLYQDTIDDLGQWTELELMVDSEDLVEAAGVEIERLLVEFGFDPSRIERRTYVEMKLENLMLDYVDKPAFPLSEPVIARHFRCSLERVVKILAKHGRKLE